MRKVRAMSHLERRTQADAAFQSCKSFARVTERKHVWLRILARDVCKDLVPPYCKPIDTLSSYATEVLTCHLLRVQQATTSDTISGKSHRLHQPRSITWVRLLQGAWLLVAASDVSTSSLSLWSVHEILSSSQDSAAPSAEVYLDGPVQDGEVHILGNQVSVALDVRTSRCVTCWQDRLPTLMRT